ncbi:MAG TPA: hypothetical protein VMR73_02560 [Candidatus Paceibacterota bacterium]|nr:hypothetical protein [Candidatus Paceibacterota bacterium]
MTLSPETKKWIWTTGVLAVIILLIFGANEWQKRMQANAEALAHPCVINFLATFLYNVSATTTKESVAKTLLAQYLNAYEHVPHCPSEGIKDYAITSVAPAVNVNSDFTDKVIFDLSPASTTATVWATAETHWDGGWIRGKEATLGIQHIVTSTSTDATSTYRLVI